MGTEQQLLNDIQLGARGARRQLYDRYAGYLMAVCMRYLANREAAQDVLQESFIKIFTSISRFNYRGEGSLKAWLTRLTANESVNWLRKEHSKNEWTGLMEEESSGFLAADEEAFAAGDVEPDVGNLSMAELQRLIEELPAGYRAVFNMFVFEQRSHKEIAALLGIKENTSASQLLRAKKTLARKIEELIKQKRK